MAGNVHLDGTFGHGGFTAPAQHSGHQVNPEVGLRRQKDGKLVVGGTAQMPDGERFCLALYDSHGAPDQQFGEGGETLSKVFARGWAVALQRPPQGAPQADGQYLLIGGTSTADSHSGDLRFAVARFLPDGQVDETFGHNGLATVDVIPPLGPAEAADNEQVWALAVQQDGGILAGGYAYTETGGKGAVVRLHPDGALDTGFGEPATDAGLPGRVLLPSVPGPPDVSEVPDTVFSSIALQTDGKIVVAGSHGGELLLARLTPSGHFDAGHFGPHGFVTLAFPRGGATVGRVLMQPDGRILTVGTALSPSATGLSTDVTAIALARFEPDGQLDHSFGDPAVVNNLSVRKGWTLINIKTLGFEGAKDGVLDGHGRIIAVGGTEILSGFAGDFLMVRCRPDGLLDQGFSDGSGGSPGGVVDTPVPHGSGHASACVLGPGNTLTVAAGVAHGSHGTGFALARYRLD
jgi:uncharacterized delta-60 repeat protein